MNRTTAEIGTTHYAVTLDAGGFALRSDEPATRGGAGLGPSPYDLLLASLAACTAITLRMYADRKQWDLKSLRVELRRVLRGEREEIDRVLHFEGDLTAEQKARFVEIAERTPVTRTLKHGIAINTTLAEPAAAPAPLPEQ